jgi:hypothetical protein
MTDKGKGIAVNDAHENKIIRYNDDKPDDQLQQDFIEADKAQQDYWTKKILRWTVFGLPANVRVEVDWKSLPPNGDGTDMLVHEGDRTTQLLIVGWQPRIRMSVHDLLESADAIVQGTEVIDLAIGDISSRRKARTLLTSPDIKETAKAMWIESEALATRCFDLIDKGNDLTNWRGVISRSAVIMLREVKP